MKVHRLERDVFHLVGERYESGTLAVLDGDRALLVDGMAAAPDAARLREIVTVEWGKRVVLLVSTHYFSDHLAAWNLFPEAPVLAHEMASATFWTEDFRSAEEAAHYRKPTILLSGGLELSFGRHAVRILLQSAPPGVDLDALHRRLGGLPGVVDVHDLHVWTLTSEMDAASAHLMTAEGADPHAVLDQARVLLREDYGIDHATFQVEPDTHTGCTEVTW